MTAAGLVATPGLLLRDVTVGSAAHLDVRVGGAAVTEIGRGLTADGEQVVPAGGGALIPGLHDHHLHLLAVAALADSVPCGPPSVLTRDRLGTALRAATPVGGWVRGVGYDDVRLGLLDAADLDALRADVPVRVQHRGGALWVLNSAAMRRVDLADTDDPGVERDTDGHPTGRVWRAGRALRRRWAVPRRPDLARLSARLFALGITGVTDATPDQDRETVRLLRAEVRQDLLLLGDPDATGPWKIVVADHDLPSLAELVDRIAARRPRPVAVHCVSRVALVLTVEALTITGGVVGDRIEHAAVCPPEAAGRLARLGTTVVTQPSLPASRGDDYLDRVEPDEVAQLWPFASLVAAGVGVGCSSDAPYGDLDPWHSIAAAAERRTPSGRLVAPHERVNRRRALTGFLTGATAPGGSERPVLVGACADLVLLDRPLGDALRHPSAEHVRLTVRAGEVVHERGDIEDGAS